MAAVGGIADLGEAVVARGDVRHHQRAGPALVVAVPNAEAAVRHRIEPHRFEAVDDGARRTVAIQADQARLEFRPLTFELREDPLGGVHHPPIEGKVRGKAVDEGPEADPLHRTTNHDTQTLTHGPPRTAG